MVCVVYDVTNEDTITKVFTRCLFYRLHSAVEDFGVYMS